MRMCKDSLLICGTKHQKHKLLPTSSLKFYAHPFVLNVFSFILEYSSSLFDLGAADFIYYFYLWLIYWVQLIFNTFLENSISYKINL